MLYTTAHYPLDSQLIQTAIFQSSIEPKRALGKRTTGWHSEYRYSIDSAGPFKPVLTYILGLYPDMVLDRWWINVCGPNEATSEHYHGHNMTSIVYYIQTPTDSGNIEFKDPHSWFDDERSWVGYSPSAGDIVAFDGMLLHRVGANKSSDIRISIALNLITKEEFKRTGWSRAKNTAIPLEANVDDAYTHINSTRAPGTM